MPRVSHGEIVALEEVNNQSPEARGININPNLRFALPAAPKQTPFDFLFPELQKDDGNLLPQSPKTVADLIKLGSAMSEPGRDPQFDSATPAAYTYFGQFVDHDITFEAMSDGFGKLIKLNDPNLAPLSLEDIRKHIKNIRSPALDLDSVYGAMADGTPAPRDGALMRLGKVSKSQPHRPPGKDDFNDLPRKPRAADPKIDREALIGDPRNDENLIVAQLHVAFLRAHNALVKRGHTFDEARRLLRQHYQWIVIHDFLKRIAAPEIVNEILTGGNRFFTPAAGELFMPLEFSAAAYRFGHSLIRGEYNYNLNFRNGTAATLDQLFTFTAFSGQLFNFDTLPENWIIEWENFLDGGGNDARRIDTRLVEPLFALRDETGGELPDEARLAVRNLLRGYLLRVPTGQAVAQALGLPVMSEEEIVAVAESASVEQAKVLRDSGFAGRTPLWYYILAEAAASLPDHLGAVGGTLVAEVLIGLARRSEDSILSRAGWTPTLGAQPRRFTLSDLLRLAGVLK